MTDQSSEHELRSLMCAGLDGDADAHHRLLVDLSHRLRGYFRSRLLQFHRGPTEAEDLVQEVLLAVHTRRDTYDRSQPFTPWVYAIARYKLLDYLRRTKVSFRDIPADDAEHLIAQNDVDGVESAYDLDYLLATLQPKARRAIRYMKLQGLSVRETAAKSGMSAIVRIARESSSGTTARRPSRTAIVPAAKPVRSIDCAKIVNASCPDGSTITSYVSAVAIRNSSTATGCTY